MDEGEDTDRPFTDKKLYQLLQTLVVTSKRPSRGSGGEKALKAL